MPSYALTERKTRLDSIRSWKGCLPAQPSWVLLPKHLKRRKPRSLEYRYHLFGRRTGKQATLCFSYLCSHGRVGLLQQVPQFLPLFRAARVIKLFSLPLAHGLRLPPQLFVHLLLLLMIPGLATGF